MCGDFNSPIREDDDRVTPAGERHPGIEWWDDAEREILEHPRLHDVYRQRRRDGEERGTKFPVSHITRHGPKRYDHVFAEPTQWTFVSCEYRTEWLEEGLSDHAAVEVELDPR